MTDFTNLKENLAQEEQEIEKQFEEQKKNIQAKVAEYEKTLNLQNQTIYNQKMAEIKGKKIMLAEIEKQMNQNV